MDNFVEIGKITTTHGIKGEVKLNITVALVENCLEVGRKLYLGDDKDCYVITSIRPFKDNYLVCFADVDTINKALELVNKIVYVNRLELKNKKPLTINDFLGLTVSFKNKALGRVSEIMDNGAHFLIRVNSDKGDILVPFTSEFIKSIDWDNNNIKVELIKGMI